MAENRQCDVKASPNARLIMKPKGKPRGRPFVAGNPGGPGNPLAARVTALKSALLDAVSRDDMIAIARKLITLAVEDGDIEAARLILDRTLGKVADANLSVEFGGSPYKILIGVESEKIA